MILLFHVLCLLTILPTTATDDSIYTSTDNTVYHSHWYCLCGFHLHLYCKYCPPQPLVLPVFIYSTYTSTDNTVYHSYCYCPVQTPLTLLLTILSTPVTGTSFADTLLLTILSPQSLVLASVDSSYTSTDTLLLTKLSTSALVLVVLTQLTFLLTILSTTSVVLVALTTHLIILSILSTTATVLMSLTILTILFITSTGTICSNSTYSFTDNTVHHSHWCCLYKLHLHFC